MAAVLPQPAMIRSLSLDLPTRQKGPYRIKRKPPPIISIEERYPPPDPNDPFAPLDDLRRRHAPDDFPSPTITPGFSPWNNRPLTTPAKPATFHLLADPPMEPVEPVVMSENEFTSLPRRPPPRSPLRLKNYRDRSHSTPDVLDIAENLGALPGHASRQFSETGSSRPLNKILPDDLISTPPGLVRDGGHSDSSSDVDYLLSTPITTAMASPVPLFAKHTPSRKGFRRFITRKKSSSDLTRANPPSEPPPSAKERGLDDSIPSKRPSVEGSSSRPQSADRSKLLDETLATLTGLDAGNATFGLRRSVSARESVSSPRNAIFIPPSHHSTWLTPNETTDPVNQSPRHSLSSSSGASADYSNNGLSDDAGPSGSRPSTGGDVSSDSGSFPSIPQLTLAACIPVIDATGERFPFGTLFATSKIHAVFIRNWSCISSKTYVKEIIHRLSNMSARHLAEMRIVVIGNGPPTLIQKYRKACDIPPCVEVYSEPSLRVHRALGIGMTQEKDKESEKLDLEKETESNVSPKKNFAKVVARALKSSTYYGPTNMLGGGFHFGPGLACTFAHRMTGLNDYAPLDTFLALPSLPSPTAQHSYSSPSTHPTPEVLDITHTHNDACQDPESESFASETEDVLCELEPSSPIYERHSLTLSDEERAQWAQFRTHGLERMKSRKLARRGLDLALGKDSIQEE